MEKTQFWMLIFQVFQQTELQINTVVLLERWSWKGHSSVTLGKTLLCMFLVHVFWRTELFQSIQYFTLKVALKWPFIGDTACSLFRSLWRWEILEDRALLINTVFYSEGGPEMTIHWCYCMFIVQVSLEMRDFGRQSSFNQYSILLRRWSWNDHSLVLLHVHCSGLFGDESC